VVRVGAGHDVRRRGGVSRLRPRYAAGEPEGIGRRGCLPTSFKSKIEPLGMTVPPTNTPETFTAFMHKEMERQRELAKLSGHQTQIK
jgi:hypothetical protein